MRQKLLLVFTTILSFTLLWTAERIYANWFVPTVSAPTAEPVTLPDHVLYESLFRMDLSFRRKSLEQELTGKPVTSLKVYFKENANLTDQEDETLRQTAIEFAQEIRPIDTRAQRMIAKIREQFLYGEVPEGGEVTPPPRELADLQDQRNVVVLRYRDKLLDLLGKDGSKKLDRFVRSDFAMNFQAIGELPRR